MTTRATPRLGATSGREDLSEDEVADSDRSISADSTDQDSMVLEATGEKHEDVEERRKPMEIGAREDSF